MLLTLSTLSLANEKTEKCIIDTPDGLESSLVEYLELEEKGYKPCSKKFLGWGEIMKVSIVAILYHRK